MTSQQAAGIAFAKMQALGNDFMVLDAVSAKLPDLSPRISVWADRRRGVGFDQLLVLEAPQRPHQDFFCRIHNADGSLAESCYNGARCLALFARMQQLTARASLTVGFVGGELRLEPDFGSAEPVSPCRVRLHTDAAVLNPGPPLFAATEVDGIELAGHRISPRLIGVGNPHAVVMLDEAQYRLFDDLTAMGAEAQSHPLFPMGVNLSLVRPAEKGFAVRVYERGAGRTPACGTAAVAVGAAVLDRDRSADSVRIEMDGGRLSVRNGADAGILLLEGEAQLVYRGEIFTDE